MAIEQDWGKSNLRDYLLYDVWSLHGAFRVLAGLNYYGPGDEPQNDYDPDYSLDGSVGVHGNESEAKALDSLPDMREMWAIFDRLEFFWQNGRHDDNKDSPADFIKWAITKGHRPEWLDWALSSEHRSDWRDWATKHDLSTLKQGAEKTESTRKTELAFNTKMDWKENAREIGKDLLNTYSKNSLNQLAEKVCEEMNKRKNNGAEGVTGRGGKVPSAETIRRHALIGIKS